MNFENIKNFTTKAAGTLILTGGVALDAAQEKINSVYGEQKVNFDRLTSKKSKYLQDVSDFHDKFGMREGWEPTDNNLFQRGDMMYEEVEEYDVACRSGDKVEIADSLVDLIYFAVGTADLLGLDFDKHWDAVQTANMNKVRGTKSTRPNSGGYDMIKPEGWVGPNERHAEILKESQND